MATTLQLRRGTTVEADALTGASGELYIDTDTNQIRVHDGVTQGGHPTSDPTITTAVSNIKTGAGLQSDGSYAAPADIPDVAQPLTTYSGDYGWGLQSGAITLFNFDTVDHTLLAGSYYGHAETTAGSETFTFTVDSDVVILAGSSDYVPTTDLVGTPTALTDVYLTGALGSNYLSTATSLFTADQALDNAISTKQDTLVSGTTIKTINGTTLLGSGNVTIDAGNISSTIPGVTLAATLVNPNAYSTATGDQFGKAVGVSDTYIAVGAAYEDGFSGASTGVVYVFTRDGTLVHTIEDPNAYSTAYSDYFGSAVAITGNYLIASAIQEDQLSASSTGTVYIFNITTAELLYTIENPNAYSTPSYDYFGSSIKADGDYAIVAAYGEDDAGGDFMVGKVYIFNVTNGSLVATLDNPNAYSTSYYDVFGHDNAIGIYGNYAAVGAREEDEAAGNQSGKVYVFNVPSGELLFTLDNPNAYDTPAADYFGRSVDIYGNYLVVGAHQEDDAGGLSSGKAYIFDVTTGTLLHTLDNPNAYSTSGNDQFGYTVSAGEGYVAVTAYFEDSSTTTPGMIYIFDTVTGSLKYTIDNPGAAYNYFGSALVSKGDALIVGAYADITNPGGTVYAFDVDKTLSGTTLKTVNGQSLIGSGDISVGTLSWASTVPTNPVTPAGTAGQMIYDADKLYIHNGTVWIQFTGTTAW